MSTILRLQIETDSPVKLAITKELSLRLVLRRRELLEDTFDEMVNTLARARHSWNKKKGKKQ